MNNKTSRFIDYQNRISHYNNMYSARTAIKNTNLHNTQIKSRFHNKLFYSIERQKKIINQKLLNKLLQIHKKRTSIMVEKYCNNALKDRPSRNKKKHQHRIIKQKSIKNKKDLTNLQTLNNLDKIKQQNVYHKLNESNGKLLSKMFSSRVRDIHNFNSTLTENLNLKQSSSRSKLQSQNDQRSKIYRAERSFSPNLKINHSLNQKSDDFQTLNNRYISEDYTQTIKQEKDNNNKKNDEKYSQMISAQKLIASFVKNRKQTIKIG